MIKINIFYANTTLDKLLDNFKKIDKNYKNYKKEWSLSVKKIKDNEFEISAHNKEQFIALNRGNFYSYMKRLYIKVIPKEDYTILESRYKYPIFDVIMIQLIPISSTIIFALCVLLKVVNALGNKWDWLLILGIIVFGILSVSNFFWTKGAKKLEKRREVVLIEVLRKYNLL